MNLLEQWAEYLPSLLSGLGVSIRVAALSLALGLTAGLALAIASSARSPFVRWPVRALVETGRATPALIMLQIVYFGLPSAGIYWNSFIAASVALALTTAAYSCEIIRGGLASVPQGEVEAAHALGMSQADVLRFVVVPVGLRVSIPPLVGFSITVFQATSLAFSIALPELLGAAYEIGSSTFQYLNVLILAGLLYTAVSIPASLLTERLERRLARHL